VVQILPEPLVDFRVLEPLARLAVHLGGAGLEYQDMPAILQGRDITVQRPPIIASSGASVTHDPARLALWTEFHEKVATLSEQERAVFEMHY
jgi:hypothetical protein